MNRFSIFILLIFVFFMPLYALTISPAENSGIHEISFNASISWKAAWPMTGGNPQHTGVARRIVSEGDPQLVWTWKEEGEVFLSPIVGYDGTIYLASNHIIYALSSSGELKWTYNISENITSPPAVDKKGNVYFGGMFYTSSIWGGHIYSLDSCGKLRWKYDAGGWVQSEPVIDSTGTIYFYSSSEYLYAFHPDGSLKWRVKIPSSFSIPDAKNTPVISLNGTLYFPAGNRIVMLSPDGEILRNMTVGNAPPGGNMLDYVAAMSRDTIYIGIRACGLGLYAIGVDGDEKWHYNDGRIKGAPAIAPDGTVYVVADKSSLLAINPDGDLKWSFGGEKYLISPQRPSISGNGVIYVTGKEVENGEERYFVYGIDSNGKLIWKYEIDGEGNAPALGNDGFLYTTTSRGTLYAFKIGKCVKREPSLPGVRLRIQNHTAILEITPSFDNGGMPIEKFVVYRSINSSEFQKVAEVENTTYEEKIEEGRKYRYYVTALNSIGESEKSNIVEISFENEYLGDKNSVYYVIFGVSSILIIFILYYSSKR